MEKLRQKTVFIFIIFIIFTPSFLFFKVPTNYPINSSLSTPQHSPSTQNILFSSESAPESESISVKISIKFQNLLKTQDATQRVSCFIILKEQPGEIVARQIKQEQNIQDRGLLRKMIYMETKKNTLPLQNELVTPISLLGGKILRNYVIVNALFVDIPLQAIPRLAELSQIVRIEPNYQLQIQLDVSQDIVINTTPPGWDYVYDGSGVVVAVCDTGIDKTHSNLAGRVIAEKSFVPGEPATTDGNGHGTHVAGIIASNHSTYHGIAAGVDLVNVKIMANTGSGETTYLVDGIEWLLNETGPGADVINLSAGTTELTANGETSLARFVDSIVSEYGIVWVNAAGNAGSSGLEVPGDAINCISVANFDDHNNLNPAVWTISGSSSQGPTADGREKPDIAAPGTNIISCMPGGGFTSKSGTSMAAPHVAGAAALLWQYLETKNASIDSSWYSLIIKGIILNTAYDLGSVGYDYSFGYGAIDMGAVWNFLQTGDFAVRSISNSGFFIAETTAEYQIILNTPQSLEITVVWNRYASTNFTHTSYYGLSNINIHLENEAGEILALSASTKDNVEHISYSASNGTYYFYVDVDAFNHDPQEYVVVSSSPLTFIRNIGSLQFMGIMFIISIVGIAIVAIIYTVMWLRERKAKPAKDTYETESTLPEWPGNQF